MQIYGILHINDSNITKLYIVIQENRVISISKTVQEMLRDFKDIYPSFKDRNTINQHFKKHDVYYLQNAISGEQYTIQKIENTNKAK